MKFIEQPESYSDMLVRVFTISLLTGVICTVALGVVSPNLKQFIESIPGESEIGPLKGLHTLYVLIPFMISLFSRSIKLHDKISNLFGIRFKFDVDHILLNLARETGFQVNKQLKEQLKKSRQDAMYAIFYPYVSFNDPKIDKQLVRSTLDSWGWFWSDIESSVILIIALLFMSMNNNWFLFVLAASFQLALFFLMIFHWFECRTYAIREVKAILKDNERKWNVQKYFIKICHTT